MFIGFGDMGITGYRSRQLWSWRNDGSRNEVMEGRGLDGAWEAEATCVGSQEWRRG